MFTVYGKLARASLCCKALYTDFADPPALVLWFRIEYHWSLRTCCRVVLNLQWKRVDLDSAARVLTFTETKSSFHIARMIANIVLP